MARGPNNATHRLDCSFPFIMMWFRGGGGDIRRSWWQKNKQNKDPAVAWTMLHHVLY